MPPRASEPLDFQGASNPAARIGEFVGQLNLATTTNVYSHVMLDETGLDYAALLERDS